MAMAVIVVEVYQALKKLGLDDELATAAAKAVIGTEHREDVVTRSILRAELAGLKTELIQWTVATLLAMTAIFAGIVKLL